MKKNKEVRQKPGKINFPNRLSIARMVLIPIILLVLLFPYEQFDIIVPVFVFGFVQLSMVNVLVLTLFFFASITDALDGWIARRYNLVTTLGRFIDPAADKLLTTTLFIVYAWQGLIPLVPAILMLWRDILVDGIRMVCAERGKILSAGILGKIKTFTQMLTIALITVNNLPFELWNIPATSILLWFSTLISLFSGFQYYYQARGDIFASK